VDEVGGTRELRRNVANVLVMGARPRQAFDTRAYVPLVQAVDAHFNVSDESRKVEGYSDILRITVPREHITADFMVRASVQQHGYLCIQYRLQADPVPLTWMLRSLDQALSFILSDAAERVVRRDRRDYIVSLSGIPEGGVSLPSNITAERISFNQVKGMRVVRILRLAQRDKNGWAMIREFAAATLSDIGYGGFEPGLQALDSSHIDLPTVTAPPPRGGRPDA
jgi:hypothetical protein